MALHPEFSCLWLAYGFGVGGVASELCEYVQPVDRELPKVESMYFLLSMVSDSCGYDLQGEVTGYGFYYYSNADQDWEYVTYGGGSVPSPC